MRCACGEREVDEYGTSGVYMCLSEEHTPKRCEIEDWRTPWWRFWTWAGIQLMGLAGAGRKMPRVRIFPAGGERRKG